MVGVLLLTFLSACARGPRCPTTPITEASAALASLQSRSAPIRSLRAEARVDQRGREGRIKGRVMMFVERPDHVRFDAVTQFGPALVFTSDGEQITLSDFKANRFLTGPACERNIARVFGVALSGQDVASVLLGESPPIDTAGASLRCEGGHYILEQRAQDGGRQELTLRVSDEDRKLPPEQQRLYLASATFWDAQGRRLYRVRYEDYGSVSKGQAELPFTVRIEDFINDADAVLRFQSIDVNVNVPAEAFSQAPRPGLTVEAISCE
jgi:outer membrane lipoprotein-sorting protein